MSEQQRTLATPVVFEGTGLHTGEPVRLELRPAPPNSGVTFVRTDLGPDARVPVAVENRRENPRRSTLGVGDVEVQTVEHLLACFNVLGIQNAEVHLNSVEVPGLDGSAQEFLAGIQNAGVEDQGVRARCLEIRDPVAVQSNVASLVALPGNGAMRVSYTLHYDGLNGTSGFTQHFDIEINEDTFKEEIAPARTFVLEREAKELQSKGLGRGANETNTVVVSDDGTPAGEARFPNECVRHKILDLLGDLFILGSSLKGHVVAHRSGHALNTELAVRLAEVHSREREVEDILLNAHRGLDIRQLQKVLPHRYPFLLVDRVLEVDGDTRAVGLKNVTFNEEFFQGHFPGQPVMPGVLQIEAMAQLAGILLLRKAANINKLAYILSIDNVKFRRTVVPGDQLILEAEVKKLKLRTGQVQTKASVDGSVVAEATIRFMIVDAY